MVRWAHSANATGARQSLRDHLLGTATLARRFGAEFGAGDAAYAIGLLHDAGKIGEEWQLRLLSLEANLPARQVDHKRLGALLSTSVARSPGVFAIQGHHGGIPDRPDCPRGAPDQDLMRELLLEVPEVASMLQRGQCLPSNWATVELVEFGTRMLHSALVDADYLDTSAHFAGEQPALRPDEDFTALVGSFERGRTHELGRRASSPLDEDRRTLYAASVSAAGRPRGLYRMSAPTGSGKTIAAAGFALHHAAVHRLRRVVVAVPFTTITEQNAAVYRRLLGDDVVLEHHSAVEPEGVARYGIENWDAPFVVTTTVQLFESLFSNKPSKTRKLHRLCNSVIVLDEVQALPKDLLNPILDAIRILVSHFGATVLLASATQPSFESLDSWKKLNISPVEIVPDPSGLYRRLARVKYEWRRGLSIGDLAESVAGEQSALVVLNTTAGSRQVANELQQCIGGESVRHLSTRMCRAHRSEVLREVRERLRSGRRVHLVSTQLIEAGVDVDFPVVFRQEAPAESVIQAAGRANRERLMDLGRVTIFSGPGFQPLREYRTGIGVTDMRFGANPDDLNDPTALARYFTDLYSLLNTDQSGEELQRWRQELWFSTIADRFRMIDSATVPVLVDWDGAHAWFDGRVTDRMRAGHEPVPMGVLRAAQRYVVEIPNRLATADYAGFLHETVRGLFVWLGPYSLLTGVGSAEPTSFIF